MADPRDPARIRLERLPAHAWAVIAILLLSVLYGLIDVALVRPYLWPAGTGALVTADPASRWPLIARPPDIRQQAGRAVVITEVAPARPRAVQGLAPGSALEQIAAAGTVVDLRPRHAGDAAAGIDTWRSRYWSGVSGPVTWTVRDGGAAPDASRSSDPASPQAVTGGWVRLHLGMVVQLVVFLGGAVVLLLLRSDDRAAGLCAAALRAQRRGGRRAAARGRRQLAAGACAHGVRVDRQPAGVPDHRARHPALPVPVSVDRPPSVAAGGAVRGRGDRCSVRAS